MLPGRKLGAQLGFGPLADRWRPRVLMIVGPLGLFDPLAGLGSRRARHVGMHLRGRRLGAAGFHRGRRASASLGGERRGSRCVQSRGIARLLLAVVFARWPTSRNAWTPCHDPGVVVLAFSSPECRPQRLERMGDVAFARCGPTRAVVRSTRSGVPDARALFSSDARDATRQGCRSMKRVRPWRSICLQQRGRVSA